MKDVSRDQGVLESWIKIIGVSFLVAVILLIGNFLLAGLIQEAGGGEVRHYARAFAVTAVFVLVAVGAVFAIEFGKTRWRLLFAFLAFVLIVPEAIGLMEHEGVEHADAILTALFVIPSIAFAATLTAIRFK